MIKKRRLIIIGVVIAIVIAFFIVQFIADAAAVNKLEINIKEVNLTAFEFTSCNLWVTVNFTNPTNRDLSITAATFDVFVAKTYVGNSKISQLSIPKISSREQSISLTLLYSDIAQAVVEGIKNKNFDIYVSGEAQAKVFYELFTVSVPFNVSSTYS